MVMFICVHVVTLLSYFTQHQAEREMRHRVETAFKSFMEKVQQFSNLEFDHTFRDLGFYGVPQRSSVFLQPTTYCLVHLVESPVTVITLSELELAHFERVSVSAVMPICGILFWGYIARDT